MTTPADPVAAPAAIRARVRAAVERAWADAVAGGRLPALEDPATAPAIEVERPANATFGDFATNLAMKLARPMRRSPLDIAEALAESLRGEAGVGLVASAEVARPGFVNVRIMDTALREPGGRRPRGTGGMGPDPDGQPAQGQRGVRLRQPDRAADRGQRPRSVRGRPAVPRPRGRRPDGDRASTTSTTRAPRSTTWARPSGPCSAASPCPRTGTRARTSRRSPARSPTTCGPPPRPMGRTRRPCWAPGRPTRVRAMIEASLSRLGVHFDVWKSEASLHDEGWVAAGGRAAAGRGPGLRAGRRDRGSGRPPSATTRTGSSTAPTDGRRTSPRTSAT